MEKIIVTNNSKISTLNGRAQVNYLDGKSILVVLEEGLKLAETGGKLLADPNKGNPAKAYYKSIPFFKNGDSPDQQSIEMLKRAINTVKSAGLGEDLGKEPMLAGVQQKGDYETIQKLLG